MKEKLKMGGKYSIGVFGKRVIGVDNKDAKGSLIHLKRELLGQDRSLNLQELYRKPFRT